MVTLPGTWRYRVSTTIKQNSLRFHWLTLWWSSAKALVLWWWPCQAPGIAGSAQQWNKISWGFTDTLLTLPVLYHTTPHSSYGFEVTDKHGSPCFTWNTFWRKLVSSSVYYKNIIHIWIFENLLEQYSVQSSQEWGWSSEFVQDVKSYCCGGQVLGHRPEERQTGN